MENIERPANIISLPQPPQILSQNTNTQIVPTRRSLNFELRTITNQLNNISEQDIDVLKNTVSKHLSTFTPIKEIMFAKIFAENIVANSNSNEYTYIDFNAGRGQYGNILGSPVIMKRLLSTTNFTEKNMILFELDDEKRINLQMNMRDSSANVSYHADHNNSVKMRFVLRKKELINNKHGILLVDHLCQPPVETIYKFFNRTYDAWNIDLCMNIQMNSLFRHRGIREGRTGNWKNKPHGDPWYNVLELLEIQKRYKLISKPMGRQRWTFFIATNNENFKNAILREPTDFSDLFGRNDLIKDRFFSKSEKIENHNKIYYTA